MSFEKPQRYQPLQGWEPNVATEFALEVRLDRLEKRLFKWIRFMAIALLISLLIAVWALTYSFMGNGTVDTYAPSPMTTDVSVIPDKSVGYHMHDKRFGWFAAIKLGFSIANLGFSLYGLYKSCKGYSDTGDSGSGVLCVWSAISTVVTLGGMGNAALGKLAEKGREAGDIAAQGIELADLGAALPGSKKRSELDLNEILGPIFNKTDYNAYAKSVFPELDFELHGWVSANNTRHGHLVPEGHTVWPVNTFTNHHGHRFHHMAVPGFAPGHTRHRIGFANPPSTNSSISKRACDGCFEDEYFTEGGLDWTACDGGDTEHLNAGDFNQMEPEIECYVTEDDLKNNAGLEFQVYDSTKHETLGAGSIAAFTADGKTYLQNMEYCPAGIVQGGCGATKESSG